MRNDADMSPKVAIPGHAGQTIAVALQRMAQFAGDASITIIKKRLPGGGYSYCVLNQAPAQADHP